jgi:hypothetical protein
VDDVEDWAKLLEDKTRVLLFEEIGMLLIVETGVLLSEESGVLLLVRTAVLIIVEAGVLLADNKTEALIAKLDKRVLLNALVDVLDMTDDKLEAAIF